MRKLAFDKTALINTPVERLYQHLAKPANYIGLQPLLTEVIIVGEGKTGQDQLTITYYTVEAFRFFGLPCNNKIKVTMTLTIPNKEIVAEVKSFPNLHLKSVFTFSPKENQTELREQIWIEVMRPLLNFSINQAQQAHNALFENLQKRMKTNGYN